jgi:DNA adenine methylase
MAEFPSPLRYPGGKSRIFPFVSRLFYENEMIGFSYAEPYAGGSGLALKLLFDEYVDKIYLNDLDQSIYAFWVAVVDHADEICDWIMEVDLTIRNWRHYKKIHSHHADFSQLDLAKATFFLNRTNVSGVIKGGMIGGLAQRSKYNIDARFYREESVAKIRRIAGVKHRIRLSNLDGIAFIDRLNRRKENLFIYLDPPYFHKASELYMNHYISSDHTRLSRHVQRLQKRWMVSYDDQEFILKLYSENKALRHSLARGASNQRGNEILVFSDNVHFQNSTTFLQAPSLVQPVRQP